MKRSWRLDTLRHRYHAVTGLESNGGHVPEYLAPGVYVEEVSFRAKSIQGVSTSTTGFVGTSSAGPRDVAVRVASFADYARTFGGLESGDDLAHAVQLFFANGGADLWVVGVDPRGSSGESLAALEEVPDLAVLCIPGQTDPATLAAALHYVERRRAFLIVDPPGPDPEAALALTRELAATGSANAAVYFPPISVPDPSGDGEQIRPPGGAVAGVFARTDVARGVWKAPAGTEATLLGVRGVGVALSEAEASALHAGGVNTIRTFPNIGTVVWGARTIQGADSAASEWKYVNVRRMVVYLEHSIDRGTRWAVFEPNDEPLWASLRLTAGAFLDGLFRAGAFRGPTPREAYFVRCDRSTMTQDDLDNGRVNVMVGVAPERPAEFVIFQIGQWTASEATEQLGPTTADPRQEFELAHRPAWSEGFLLQVEDPMGWTAWRLVESFDGAGPADAVFTLDAESGVVRFGDGACGAIPSAGSAIEVRYRYGSGRAGNETGPARTRAPDPDESA